MELWEAGGGGNGKNERLCGGKCIIKNPHPPPASEEPLFHVDSVNDTQLPEMLA